MIKLTKKREKIVEVSRSWLDTPYHHKARVKGLGVDCAQLCAGIALEMEFITEEEIDAVEDYDAEFHVHNDEERLHHIIEGFGCTEVIIGKRQAGDIVTFNIGRSCGHLGILTTENSFVHALLDQKVIEVNLQARWSRQLRKVYRFPGVR